MPVSAYQYGIEIPQNADMNTYKTPGKFVSVSSSVTSTLENSPFSNGGFRLEVRSMIDPNNGASIQQIAYPGNMNAFKQFAIRTFLNTVWDGWLYFSDDATVSLYQTMTSTNDVLQSAENQPSNQTKFYWLGGAGYTGDIPSGGSYSYGTAIALKRGTSSIFVVIFSTGKPIYNSYTNNSWSGWKDCTGTLISS